VWRLLQHYGGEHGVQAKIARILGCSTATVSLDLARILRDSHRERYGDPDEPPPPPEEDLGTAVARYKAAMAAGHRGGLSAVTDALLAGRNPLDPAAEPLPPTAAELRARLTRLRREMGLPRKGPGGG
jgi:hypothetical protein